MKKNLLLLFGVVVIFAFAPNKSNAQYLNPDYYGFEMADVKGDGSSMEFGWYIFSGDGFSQSDDFTFNGSAYSLKIGSDDYAVDPDTEWRIDCGSANKVGSEPQITETGNYELSFKVYIPSGSVPIDMIKTIYSDPKENFADGSTNAWVQNVWDISAITVRDKWITLKQVITIDVVGDLETPVRPKQLQLRVLKASQGYRPTEGSGYIYIDDVKLTDPVDTNDPEFVLDEWYFGFENGPDSWWIPPAQRGYIFIQSDIAADGGTFSLQFKSDDWSKVSLTALAPQSTIAKGGTLRMISGQLYDVSMKVNLMGDAQPNIIATNVKANADKVGFQAIPWNLPTTVKEEWVDVKQTILYLAFDATDQNNKILQPDGTVLLSEIAMKIDKNNYPQSGSGSLFLDDFNMVKNNVPTIMVENSPVAFTTDAGVESATQALKVSAGNLTEGVNVVAPSGFEVALVSDGAFASSLTIPATGSWVNQVSVYVRIAASASSGTLSGDLEASSAGAETIIIPLEGTVSVSTDITSTKSGVEVYPNPVSEILNIAAESQSLVRVYNMAGTLVKEKRLSSSTEVINVSDLLKGMYIVEVTNKKDSVVKKINVK